MFGKSKCAVIVTAVIMTPLLVLLGIAGCSSNNAAATEGETGLLASAHNKAADLRCDMRSLWMYHGWYTREVVIAAAQNAPNLNASLAALLNNQKDIGNAVAAYFGPEAGNTFTNLLTDHINIAVEVVTAAATNNQAAFTEANTRWHKNAQDIANAAHAVNPSWDTTVILDDLNMHLSTLTDMVTAILGGNYSESITKNAVYIEEILLMADDFSDGIIKQLPDDFK